MNSSALVLGFLICAVGLYLSFVMFEPLGFVLDGLGWMIFLYGLVAKEEKAMSTQEVLPEDNAVYGHSDQTNRCGNCGLLGTEFCPRHESLVNAIPCDKFYYLPRR